MEKFNPENLNDGIALRAYCLGYLGMSLSDYDRLSLQDLEAIQFWRTKRDQRDDILLGTLCTMVAHGFGNKKASIDDFIPGLAVTKAKDSKTLHAKFKLLAQQVNSQVK